MNAAQTPEKKKRPRTCVGCGEESPKRALIRVIRTPDGEVKYDPTGKANGRGAYVCCNSGCIGLAKKKKAFSRALKVQTDESLYETLETLCADKSAEDNDGGK